MALRTGFEIALFRTRTTEERKTEPTTSRARVERIDEWTLGGHHQPQRDDDDVARISNWCYITFVRKLEE